MQTKGAYSRRGGRKHRCIGSDFFSVLKPSETIQPDGIYGDVLSAGSPGGCAVQDLNTGTIEEIEDDERMKKSWTE